MLKEEGSLKYMGSMSDLNYHPSIEKESYELSSSIQLETLDILADILNHYGSN